MYNLIGCDIDGTILRSDGSLSKRVIHAIHQCVDSGAEVALVTGRCISSALPIAARIGLEGWHIVHLGACIIDAQGKILMAKQIPRSLGLELCRSADKVGCEVAVFEDIRKGRSVFFTSRRQLDGHIRHWLEMGSSFQLVSSYEEACHSDPIQITLYGTQGILEQMRLELDTRFAGRVSYMEYWLEPNGNGIIDVFAQGVSKSAGLAWMAARRGLRTEDILAFGDSMNDKDMLRFVGLGIAMSNATDDVKACADMLAPSNDDDGVAKVLESLSRHGLIGKESTDNGTDIGTGAYELTSQQH